MSEHSIRDLEKILKSIKKYTKKHEKKDKIRKKVTKLDDQRVSLEKFSMQSKTIKKVQKMYEKA